jgi:hypothetical protein
LIEKYAEYGIIPTIGQQPTTTGQVVQVFRNRSSTQFSPEYFYTKAQQMSNYHTRIEYPASSIEYPASSIEYRDFLCKTKPIYAVFGPKTNICGKNKAKQTQFKPNSKPISSAAKMEITDFIIRCYENIRLYGRAKTNPIQSQNKPKIYRRLIR